MQPGDEFQIKPNLIIRTFARGTAKVARVLRSGKKKNLKKNTWGCGRRNCSAEEENIAIDYPVEVPIVTYLGDTQYCNFANLICREEQNTYCRVHFYGRRAYRRALAGRICI